MQAPREREREREGEEEEKETAQQSISASERPRAASRLCRCSRRQSSGQRNQKQVSPTGYMKQNTTPNNTWRTYVRM